jgi:pimeloyl-ACP methyl ester carboxylesterase
MKSLINAAVASTLLLGASSFAADRPSIVLVHGAFEDVHVWDKVTANLQADGYHVIAIDLPGRPSAPMAIDKVSADVYRDTVLQAVAKEARPVVLVGHSFGGIAISAAGEAEPQRVKTLVYLAAYLPKNGDSLLSLATVDRDSKMGPQLNIDKVKGIASVNRAARADLFANDGPDGLRKAIPDMIIDEPLSPLATPVTLTPARFGKVDKVYIHTTQDQVVSPYLQGQMVAATPVRLELTLSTGHTPFLTDVSGLTAAIERAAH